MVLIFLAEVSRDVGADNLSALLLTVSASSTNRPPVLELPYN